MLAKKQTNPFPAELLKTPSYIQADYNLWCSCEMLTILIRDHVTGALTFDILFIKAALGASLGSLPNHKLGLALRAPGNVNTV